MLQNLKVGIGLHFSGKKRLIFGRKNKQLKQSMEQKEKKEKMDAEGREWLLRQLDDLGDCGI